MPAGLVSRQNLLRAPSLESWAKSELKCNHQHNDYILDSTTISSLSSLQDSNTHTIIPNQRNPGFRKLSSAHSWNFPLSTTSTYWKGNHPCRSRVRFSLPSAFSENRNRRVVCSGSGTSIGRTKLINCHQQR